MKPLLKIILALVALMAVISTAIFFIVRYFDFIVAFLDKCKDVIEAKKEYFFGECDCDGEDEECCCCEEE